jgi:RNase P protein component
MAGPDAPSLSVSFRPHEHLRKRVDFEAAYNRGLRLTGRYMTMFARPNGGDAVTRNRAKRLTRELFRTRKPAIAIDLVVVPRREFLDASYATLEREFAALLDRAVRTAARGEGGQPSPGERRRARSPRTHPRV